MRNLAAGLLALALLAPGCKKPPPPPVPTPVPTPTPGPSNDVLAFTRAGVLYGSKTDGRQQRVLAALPKGQAVWFPSATPDGSAFLVWVSRPDGTEDVARVELSGRVTLLTDIGEQAQPGMKNLSLGNAPSSSPDGKHVAYSFNGNLWTMDSNGYNAETLIADSASWAPSYSPDGKHLAYVNGKPGHYDLWVTDLDSRDTYQVTDFNGYTVGRPQWTGNGQKIMMTRSQGEECDLVEVLAVTDMPLADADVLTRDHASSSAVFNPSFTSILYSSTKADSSVWDLYLADANGSNSKQLTKGGALSPAWLRPGTGTAMTWDGGPSRPTPVVAASLPTPASKPATASALSATAQIPGAVTAAAKPAAAHDPGTATAATATAPAKPAATAPAPAAGTVAAGSAQAPAKPSAPAGSPAAPASTQAPVKASAPVAAATKPAVGQAAAPAPAPTQPPLKAAPLRLRYKAGFDAKDGLTPSALSELKKLAPRVKQYAGEQVSIFGPLDSSPLKGRYATNEGRSKARAQAVATELVKLAGLEAPKVKALPFSPPSAGGAPNSIQIYVELR